MKWKLRKASFLPSRVVPSAFSELLDSVSGEEEARHLSFNGTMKIR